MYNYTHRFARCSEGLNCVFKTLTEGKNMEVYELFEQLYANVWWEWCSLWIQGARVEVLKKWSGKRRWLPYCAITDWVWVDLEVDGEQRQGFIDTGIHPSFVRTSDIILDEARRPHITNSVRSTALVDFHRNCIFATRNTSYILVGTGSWVMIKPEVLASLKEW